MASVMELLGRLKLPETERFVVVALVITPFIITLEVAKKSVELILTAAILAGLKFVANRLFTESVAKDPLVDVRLTKIPLVLVTVVPEAELNTRGPVSTPPASGK